MHTKYRDESHALPVDNHPGMFRNILSAPRIQAWKQAYRRWQLHISGGPGSGKTTLANLIASQLRATNTGPVILVHIYDNERIVHSACPPTHGKTPFHSHGLPGQAYTSHDMPLETEAIHPAPPEITIERLCAVLAALRRLSDVYYLIIDGYDQLKQSSQALLQEVLCLFKTHGPRVLLLSAVAELALFPPADHISCNICGRGEENEEGLQIYWTCDLCPYDLCDECKSEGRHCNDSQHLMTEPYNAIHMRLDTVPSELKIFVRMDLEAEYGAEVDDNIVGAICDPSDGNVNIAKLRLDQIRDLAAPQDILSASDRLPREIVAFFDAEIERISALDPQQRVRTLLAIVAVAASDWISVGRLEELLSRIGPSEMDERDCQYIHVRGVLRSARGLLSSFVFHGNMMSGHTESDRHRIGLYVRDLGWYVREDYNQDLILVKQYFSQAQPVQGNLDRAYGFDNIVGTSKDSANCYRRTLAEVQSTKRRVCQATARNVVDAIVREPGDLCAYCQVTVFRGKSNSGVRTWSHQHRRERCRVCLSVFGMMEAMALNTMDVHWARRTMGQTSDFDNCLVLTLRCINLHTQSTFQRLAFMLKSEIGSSLVPNDPGKSTALEYTGQQIKTWLHICQTEHTHCTHTKVNSYVPKRLVEIDTGGSKPYRVIKREDKMEGPYVTLSHSWGRNPDFLTLTTKNLDSLMSQGFSDSELRNMNFEQAIEVTKHLGVKYIWIDSLCICQAGKDKDFKEEGQYMHQVYQSSFCNLVAADSRDAQGGLFRERSDLFSSAISTKESWIMLDKDLWEKELLQSPIYTRGWVFQERMLSPRIIHFTHTQVFWECSTTSACETLPGGLPFALSARATTDRRWRGRLQLKTNDPNTPASIVEDSLEAFWKTTVLNYTSCELTNQIDKTLAIWSVAKLVRDNLQLTDQYGCGLWSVALHEQLAWQVKTTKSGARMDILQSLFPSWSWASVNAPIQIQDRIVMKRYYTVKNHQGDPLNFSDFKDGALDRNTQPQFAASDSLAVRGHIIPGQLVQHLTSEIYAFESKEAGFEQYYEVLLDDPLSESLLRSSKLHLLPLVAGRTSDEGITYSGSALVLITTHDYKQRTLSKLIRQMFALVRVYHDPTGTEKHQEGLESDLRTIRRSIDALNACRHRMTMQDRKLPSRKGNAFRRIGVTRFHNICAEEWAKINTTPEKKIWLD